MHMADTGMFSADFHVHTSISWCAAEEMTLEGIARTAGMEGLETVGLADHLWLDPRRGTRPALSRLLTLREKIADLRSPVRFLLGAEADCAPHRGVAGAGETDKLDFVIASYHFADVREGAVPRPSTPEELAALLIGGFRSVVSAPGILVAGHPFYIPPAVYRRLPPSLQERIGEAVGIVLREAGPVFEQAARRGIAVELNARALGPVHRRMLLPLFRLAVECGCAFTVSSDSHGLRDLGRTRELKSYMKSAGITSASLRTADGVFPSALPRSGD
jgi:histidinol phosphatase-like PHP family hydrolase